MKQEHQEFLRYVQKYVTDNPEVAAYISNFVAEGINESRKEEMKTIDEVIEDVAKEVGANAMYKDPVAFAVKVNSAYLAQQEPGIVPGFGRSSHGGEDIHDLAGQVLKLTDGDDPGVPGIKEFGF